MLLCHFTSLLLCQVKGEWNRVRTYLLCRFIIIKSSNGDCRSPLTVVVNDANLQRTSNGLLLLSAAPTEGITTQYESGV